MGAGAKRIYGHDKAVGEDRMNASWELSVHQDDLFTAKGSSGLDAVRLCGIDQEAKARREQQYRLENIAIGKKSELKELGL